MPSYSNGKIYKITSGVRTYIGSTTQPTLAKRLAQHVGDYKRWKDGKRRNTTSFQLIETGNYEITLLELCPCGSKDELIARERFHIENTECVNKRIEGRTEKEWYEANKEYLIEKQKVYRKANAEAITERQNVYRQVNAEAIAEQKKVYRKANDETITERQNVYRQVNAEAIAEQKKHWYEANKESLIEKQKVYNKANRVKINERRRELNKLKNLNV